ncbi:hypothetical protein ACQ4M3_20430 [Leptolyngbya sp. AN03gr2]|uniref:hypothetical protein n=1 Tax=unclassified Leptolyngbya TaxID=2650499 RepID=UPI003D31B218
MLTPDPNSILNPDLFWQILNNHPPTARLRQEVERSQQGGKTSETIIKTITNSLRSNPAWLQELQLEAISVQPRNLPLDQIHLIQQSLKLVYGLIIANNTILEKLCWWAKERIEIGHETREVSDLCTSTQRLLTYTLSSINWVKQLHTAYVSKISELLKQAESIANEEFEGKISLLKLQAGWKVVFGSVATEEQVSQVPTFTTFYNGLQWLIDEKLNLETLEHSSDYSSLDPDNTGS